MKRLIFPMLVLACLALPAPILRASSPCCEDENCCKQADASYADELLDILQTTKSVDAYVVTLNLLVDTEVEPRTAIPAIIRSAERLGILSNELQQDQEDQDKPSALVIEVLGKLKDRIHAAHRPVKGATIGGQFKEVAKGCKSDKMNIPSANGVQTPAYLFSEGLENFPFYPPEKAEVLLALSWPTSKWDCFTGTLGSRTEIVTELLADEVEDGQYYPLVGLAQKHHLRWKCTVNYKEGVLGTRGFYNIEPRRPEVVYIDKEYLVIRPPVEVGGYTPDGEKTDLGSTFGLPGKAIVF